MLIVCDSCGAEYEIDVDEDEATGLSGRGLRFRCSACGHTFSVGDGPQPSVLESLQSDVGVSQPAAEAPPPMLLKQEGKVYQVDDVATLQRWIVERRVLREDLLSIGGLKWEPVGSRVDLQVFFSLVEHAERAALASSGAGAPPVDDASGTQGVQGAVPWETGIDLPDAVNSALPFETGSLPFPAADGEAEESADDEGTDAGLPVGDFLSDSLLSADGAVAAEALPQQVPAGAAAPLVPNLAHQLEPDLQPTEEAERDPAPEPAVETTSDAPSLEDEPFFTDERPLPGPAMGNEVMLGADEPMPGRRDQAPLGWILGIGAVLAALGLAWWMSRPPVAEAPPSSAPVEATLRPGGGGGSGPSTAAASTPDAPAADAPASDAPAADAPEAGSAAEPSAGDAAAAPEASPAQAALPAEPAPTAQPARTEAAAAPAAQARGGSGTADATRSSGSGGTAAGSGAATTDRTARAEPPPPAAPASPRKLIDAGWAAVERGDYSGARSSFEQARQLAPGNADALFGVGYAYEKLGNLSAAQRYYCEVASSGAGESRIEAEGRLRALSLSCE